MMRKLKQRYKSQQKPNKSISLSNTVKVTTNTECQQQNDGNLSVQSNDERNHLEQNHRTLTNVTMYM